jgi:hypothetical protein
MKTLTINDLVHTNELGRAAMTAVRGGYSGYSGYSVPTMPSYSPKSLGLSYPPSGSTSIDAQQSLTQFQSVVNATANGSAFIEGVDVHNNTSQFGQNNIVVAH